MSPCENFATPYLLSSCDDRVHVAVYPGRPTYLYVTYDEVSEGEIDAVLLDLAAQIPAPCCVVMVPTILQMHCNPQERNSAVGEARH